MTIYPTYRCFDDALELIEELLKAHPEDKAFIWKHMVVVHAICLLPDNTPYAHAWVENTEEKRCLFKGIIDGKPEWLSAAVDEYYPEYRVQETTRYTIEQVMAENRRTVSYGPWKEEYQLLTKDKLYVGTKNN